MHVWVWLTLRTYDVRTECLAGDIPKFAVMYDAPVQLIHDAAQ